jgi:hypothetical protein
MNSFGPGGVPVPTDLFGSAPARRCSGLIASAWLGLAVLVGPTGGMAADRVSVDFIDASKPTRCAEEDNIYVKVEAQGVRSFSLSAEHPPYIGAVSTDSTAPDFTHCDMSGDPKHAFTPRTLTLFENSAIRLVGHTFNNFWRPDIVDVKVGTKVERGLHLLQLLRREPKADIEILVVYPADGYWRAKPLPPSQLADSAYGSSFLFGPIDEDQRPYVAIRSIEFDPLALRFTLGFRDGSRGVLWVAEASPVRTRVVMELSSPSPAARPFAALRSMFVTLDNADASLAAWRDASGDARSAPILGFGKIHASSARFGRDHPSRHNLSAPDHVFGNFSQQPAPR